MSHASQYNNSTGTIQVNRDRIIRWMRNSILAIPYYIAWTDFHGFLNQLKLRPDATIINSLLKFFASVFYIWGLVIAFKIMATMDADLMRRSSQVLAAIVTMIWIGIAIYTGKSTISYQHLKKMVELKWSFDKAYSGCLFYLLSDIFLFFLCFVFFLFSIYLYPLRAIYQYVIVVMILAIFGLCMVSWLQGLVAYLERTLHPRLIARLMIFFSLIVAFVATPVFFLSSWDHDSGEKILHYADRQVFAWAAGLIRFTPPGLVVDIFHGLAYVDNFLLLKAIGLLLFYTVSGLFVSRYLTCGNLLEVEDKIAVTRTSKKNKKKTTFDTICDSISCFVPVSHAPLVTQELLYLLRWKWVWSYWAFTFFFSCIIATQAFVRWMSGEVDPDRFPFWLGPLVLVSSLVVTRNLAGSTLNKEDKAIHHHFTLPVSTKQVLVSKNIAYLIVYYGAALLCFSPIISSMVYYGFPWELILLSASFLLLQPICMMSIGNFASLYFPYKMPIGFYQKISVQMISWRAHLILSIGNLPLLLSMGSMFYVGFYDPSLLWAIPLGLSGISMAVCLLYFFTLPYSAKIMEERQESICQTLLEKDPT